MGYKSLEQAIIDLEQNGHLVRVNEEVDPNLVMAAVHLRVYANDGPAVLFENVKGCEFRCASNLFGTVERSRFLFRDTLDNVKQLVSLKQDPMQALRHPFRMAHARKALPRKVSSGAVTFSQCSVHALPQVKSWPNDGGPFITLPQVYTEDVDKPGVMGSNLGMYRIQMGGNDYLQNEEVGLHYQIHRGIGVHQAKTMAKGQPLKVSVFIGGPPSHSFAAVMPLPEGISELTFAGALGGQRFKYMNKDGFVLSADADFVITGEVHPNDNKPEGPFGDHLGYYSLQHPFPVMKVKSVYHRKDAIWPFTVVGRPPQEDTQFGAMIHEITGPIIPSEIPGLKEVHAVDAAGVHPLLLAVGSERYTPYLKERRPQEILTIANHILGFGQMSLAKYLFIAANEDAPGLDCHDIPAFFKHMLERVDWKRDLHFYTNTTIDTLDYSGTGLNSGSKVVIAAAGEKRRELATDVPTGIPAGVSCPQVVMPGVLAFTMDPFKDATAEKGKLSDVLESLNSLDADKHPLIVLCDDSEFLAKTLNNFLWVTFTRSNPSHDVHGVESFVENKHWGCNGSLVIDARTKPHHAPPLILDPEVEKKVDALGVKGASLYGLI